MFMKTSVWVWGEAAGSERGPRHAPSRRVRLGVGLDFTTPSASLAGQALAGQALQASLR